MAQTQTGESPLKVLILADIHSNLAALQAVLADCGPLDRVWCMGDIVGYGPNPVECIDLLRQYPHLCVMGNHDAAAVGQLSIEEFNPAAATAALWTASQLPSEHRQYLSSLPEVIEEEPFTLVHGSLRSPLWEYLASGESAMATLNLLKTRFCLVGHSHIPFICQEGDRGPLFVHFPEDEPIALGEERWIINPGGVGQPRDGDPRPSYTIYDTEGATVSRRRVTYDIATTQRKMTIAGLPRPLIDRLSFGR